MARTLTFAGTLDWPLEDGLQAAKKTLAVSLAYTAALSVEKIFAATVVDEAVTLPMTSAKFLLLQAETNDLTVTLNGGTSIHTLKAGAGFLMLWNSDGDVTGLTVSAAVAPATLKGYIFS
jgi:hypothetical protein